VSTLPSRLRAGTLDAQLASLLWLLVGNRVPVHVVAPAAAEAARLGAVLRDLALDPTAVTSAHGTRLEDVLRQPVPLRPASGAVLVLADGRVVAAHFLRPPLRDGAGHIRPQGPAVLATWDGALQSWEHFAWGVIPELADASGLRAGDFEIELERRKAFLEALVASPLTDASELARALRGYGVHAAPS
jgi:hypothetical protein